jgi:hypothetical protein
MGHCVETTGDTNASHIMNHLNQLMNSMDSMQAHDTTASTRALKQVAVDAPC